MHKLLIHLYTHFFTVELLDLRYQRIVYEFIHINELVEFEEEVYNRETRMYERKTKVWGGRLAGNSTFRFPIKLYNKFRELLKLRQVIDKEVDVILEPLYKPAFADFKLREDIEPRDYQWKALGYTLEKKEAGEPSVLITKPPGTGKTVTYAKFLDLIKLRTIVCIGATYISKWISDANELLNIPEEQVYNFSGRKAIQKAVRLAEEGRFNYDFSVLSMQTFREFMKNYETKPRETAEEYGCTPLDFWERMECGVLGFDEAHENFHALYMTTTFVHGPFVLGLSATMIDPKPFIEDKQRIIFPSNIRFNEIKMKKYIRHVNIGYQFENMDRDRIKTTFPRNRSYSQAAYDISIYKNKKVLKNFLQMVKWGVETFFMHDTHRETDKLGLYFGRVELINVVVEFLKELYPHLDVRRFIGEDPYINIIDPDIRVTTQGSGGTGKDIKKLTTVLNFNNISSKKANEQLLGRIREIEGREDLFFVQFWCTNIKKHRAYKEDRDAHFKDKTLSISNRFYGQLL